MLLLNKLIIDSGAINILNDKIKRMYLDRKKLYLSLLDKNIKLYRKPGTFFSILYKNNDSGTIIDKYTIEKIIHNKLQYKETDFQKISLNEIYSYLLSEELPQDSEIGCYDIVLQTILDLYTLTELISNEDLKEILEHNADELKRRLEHPLLKCSMGRIG